MWLHILTFLLIPKHMWLKPWSVIAICFKPLSAATEAFSKTVPLQESDYENLDILAMGYHKLALPTTFKDYMLKDVSNICDKIFKPSKERIDNKLHTFCNHSQNFFFGKVYSFAVKFNINPFHFAWCRSKLNFFGRRNWHKRKWLWKPWHFGNGLSQTCSAKCLLSIVEYFFS